MLQIQILKTVLPFLKEVIVGKQSLRSALVNNKKKIFVLILFFASIAINIFAIPRLVELSIIQLANHKLIAEYKETQKVLVKLQQENNALKHKLATMSCSKTDSPVPKFTSSTLELLSKETKH